MSILLNTPATGLCGYVATAHSAFTAPNAAAQGTGLSFAGTAAVAGVRSTDLPGSPPRGAPV